MSIEPEDKAAQQELKLIQPGQKSWSSLMRWQAQFPMGSRMNMKLNARHSQEQQSHRMYAC